MTVALILYLSYVCTKFIGMRGGKISQSKYMKIIDRVILGQDKFLFIVQVGNKRVLIGVTSSGIREILELAEEDLIPVNKDSDGQIPVSFQDFMTKVRNKKKE